jgi:hypothetical protein
MRSARPKPQTLNPHACTPARPHPRGEYRVERLKRLPKAQPSSGGGA